MTVASTLVLGYGNGLRRDDGLGPHVALAAGAREWPGVRVLAVDQLTPELADDLATVTTVIFVDASIAPGEAVTVHRLDATRSASPPMAHACDPSALLALARLLYDRAPDAYLIEIRGADFGLGEGLSPTALASATLALERIEAVVRAASRVEAG